MISYFTYGKGSLAICEDSLTASVFDILKYLPSTFFWQLLKDALVLDTLPEYSGDIQEMQYWPKWSATNTKNSIYVEPDVFIRFKAFDVIIEAKRYDANQQSVYQLKKEIIAYYNEYADDEKEVYLIQVGGLQEICTDEYIEVNNQKVYQSKTNWSQLLRIIAIYKERVIQQQLPGQQQIALLLSDLIDAFAIHGFHQKKWLDECIYYTINQNAITQFKFKKNAS